MWLRTLVWRLGGAMDLDVEVAQVLLVGDGADSGNTAERCLSEEYLGWRLLKDDLRLGHEPLRLLYDALWQSHLDGKQGAEFDRRMAAEMAKL